MRFDVYALYSAIRDYGMNIGPEDMPSLSRLNVGDDFGEEVHAKSPMEYPAQDQEDASKEQLRKVLPPPSLSLSESKRRRIEP